MADLLAFTPHDHDVRIDRDGFVYYVRAVRWGTALTSNGRGASGSSGDGGDGGETFAGDVAGTVLASIVILIFGRLYRRCFAKHLRAWVTRRGWKVGVVRMKGDRWGAVGRVKVMHKERVSGPSVPTTRLTQLADEVRAGKFAR